MNFLKTSSDVTSGEKDSLGGSFVRATGLYPATIASMYLGNSTSSNSVSVTVNFDLDGGSKYRETVWITNQQGDNFYIDKKTGEKKYLPGFDLINSLAFVATGKEIGEVELEDKVVMLYNYELKKEIPTEVKMFTGAIGADVQLGLISVKAFKQVKNAATNKYEDTTEVKTSNEIHKVFSAAGYTNLEMKAKAEAPAFVTEWTKQFNHEYIKDATVAKKGPAKSGASANGGQSAMKSLLKKPEAN